MIFDPNRLTWRTSSRTNGTQACVEVAWPGTSTAVRDTKNREAGTLVFSAGSFADLVSLAKSGQLDL